MGLGQSIVDTAKERTLRGNEPGIFKEQEKKAVVSGFSEQEENRTG